MFARVGSYRGEAEALQQGFEGQTDALQQLDGFQGAYLLIDRQGGKGMTVTLWEDEGAMQRSAERAEQMRTEATEPSGASVESVEGYEVALTVGL